MSDDFSDGDFNSNPSWGGDTAQFEITATKQLRLNAQDYQSSSGSAEFSLDAEYVSPDNDGYQDVVNINYLLNEPGHVAAINVYSDNGVLVRALASNQILGNTGNITWDGTNDLGEKARTGIHIILVETFDLDGNKAQFRLPIVVATRL